MLNSTRIYVKCGISISKQRKNIPNMYIFVIFTVLYNVTENFPFPHWQHRYVVFFVLFFCLIRKCNQRGDQVTHRDSYNAFLRTQLKGSTTCSMKVLWIILKTTINTMNKNNLHNSVKQSKWIMMVTLNCGKTVFEMTLQGCI